MKQFSILLILGVLGIGACAANGGGADGRGVSSTVPPQVETSAAPANTPSTTTVDSPDSTTSTTSEIAATTVPEREVVTIEVRSRESWGASEPDADLTAHSIDRITVHHTARPHDDTPMEEKLQRWQNYHQSIGFGDIAYHMVIAADGTIYQGREYDYVGSTRTSYDPTGHFLPSLDGMFDELWDSPNDDDDEPDGADELSAEQLGSLLDLLAWASVEFGIPPAEIAGHRDYAATACPGTVVHEMLQSGEIAERVQERIDTSDFELVFIDG